MEGHWCEWGCHEVAEQLRAERDRARAIAVALEQRLARVEAKVRPTIVPCETHRVITAGCDHCFAYAIDEEWLDRLRAALEVDNGVRSNG